MNIQNKKRVYIIAIEIRNDLRKTSAILKKIKKGWLKRSF